MSRPVPSTAGHGRGGGDADDHRWGEADGGGCGILRRPLRRWWKWGAGAGAGGRGGGVRDSAVFFTWASEERFLEAAGLATLRRIRGGSGAARGKEGRGSAWERRDGTPGRAPHGKGCTLEEQRLVAENDVEPGLGWLAAACGRRIWRWGGGPRAARPRSDGSAGVVSGGYSRHDKRSKLPGWILSHLNDAHLNLSTDMALHIAREFLRRMAQPYDKTGSGGKKTLLTEEDLQNMAQDGMEM
ncbi:unnamed protein product [Miscanthus lutarioriparius]|uniref:Uncharacterized protein n=1 Tax=Miscanthus lutarioriparius TaxID=422564 RepID=A0A811RT72_9POAL|nr:unnamed protein product [Miscanthus lutarioriparius]